MMIRPTSPRERRLVALLILVSLIAVLWFAIVAPIAAGFSTRAQQREQLNLSYLHNQRTIASVPRLRRQAEDARRNIEAYVIGAANAEAGREQRRLRPLRSRSARSRSTSRRLPARRTTRHRSSRP